jgi:hypothetical protein
MFQSFQSSSAVLDPAANPELFQSKLAVIIKVVRICFSLMTQDSKQIFRMWLTMMQRRSLESTSSNQLQPDPVSTRHRFQLKFQRLVEEEQDSKYGFLYTDLLPQYHEIIFL